MKKVYSTILVLATMVAALCLTACGGSDDSDDGIDGGSNNQSGTPSSTQFTIARKTFNGSELKHEYFYEPDKWYLNEARYEAKDYKSNLDRRFFIWYKQGTIDIIYRFTQYGVAYPATEFKKGFNDFGYESVDINYSPSYSNDTWESKPFSGSAAVVENNGDYITLEFNNYKIFCERYVEKRDFEELTLNGRLSFKISVQENYKYENPCPDDNHPHAIDLGIGIKWSCCNVGAKAPSGYGYTYPWGVTTDKHNYIWKTLSEYFDSFETSQKRESDLMNNYPLYDQSSSQYVYIDNDISGTQYDVAYTKWGGNWRMPSEKDYQNLIDNCVIQTASLNGDYCFKITGPNSNVIYIPYSNGEEDGVLINKRFTTANAGAALYWTSSLINGNVKNAYAVDFSASDDYGNKHASIINYLNRYRALAVRPIYSK